MKSNARQIRQGKGQSMTEIALKSGKCPCDLSLIERGKPITKLTALRIAVALNTPVRDVFPEFDDLRNR